jgi:hypothetical protein
LAPAVYDELRRAALHAHDALTPEPASAIDPEIAAAHGVLPTEIRQQLRARCFSHTIRPCLAGMLEARAAAQAARA